MKFLNQCGRSMVEMLGVLAIIGVLSVGGIAGYSAAMFKYKLNKQAEAMNMLIINAMDFLKSVAKLNEHSMLYVEIFEKLNLVPEGIKKRTPTNTTYLQDMFGNSIWIFSYTDTTPYTYGIGYSLNTESNKEICRNLLMVAKGFSKELRRITTDKSSTSEEDLKVLYQAYGDQFCGDDKKCISHLNLDEIDKACHQCDEINRCRFYFIWQ